MRSLLTILAGLAAAIALAGCQKSVDKAESEDFSMGKATAPVTMIEYASVACPHCARWDAEVFPSFKAKYIDTGQVHYIAREALTGDPAIAAAGFLTARCAGKDKYFQVVEAIYRGQAEMASTGQPHQVLLNIARSAGLTDAQFESCIKDEKSLAALQARWDHYVKDFNITGTPTFVINGKVYDKGELSAAELDAAIAEAKAAHKSGA
jgi:protein-disulfide isomerase